MSHNYRQDPPATSFAAIPTRLAARVESVSSPSLPNRRNFFASAPTEKRRTAAQKIRVASPMARVARLAVSFRPCARRPGKTEGYAAFASHVSCISNRRLETAEALSIGVGWLVMEHDSQLEALLCPRLDSGDPPDALAALSGTIRQHPPDLHVLLQIGFDWTDFHLKRCRKKVYAVPRLSGLGCHDAREIKLGYLHFRILIRVALMIWLNKSPASRPRPTSS